MRRGTKYFVAGLFVVLMAAALAMTTGAQTGSGKLKWNLTYNGTRGPLRTPNTAEPTGKEALSEVLGGPTNGSDNGYLIYTRMAAGARGPAMFTLPVEDAYVVLSGKMTVQIGTDKFVAGPWTGVVIPPNTPHAIWNAESGSEANLEVISTLDPEKDLSRDLMSMMKPAQATKVDNAADCIREIKVPAGADLKPGLNGQAWSDRTKGTSFQLRLDSALTGQGNTNMHVHPFEQVYYGTEGDMSVNYGLSTFTVKPGQLVIIPIGVVHDNVTTTAFERHITILMPQLPPGSGQPADVQFDMKKPGPAPGR